LIVDGAFLQAECGDARLHRLEDLPHGQIHALDHAGQDAAGVQAALIAGHADGQPPGALGRLHDA